MGSPTSSCFIIIVIVMWPMNQTTIKYKILIRIDVDLFCASLLAWMIVTPKNIIYTNRLALFLMKME